MSRRKRNSFTLEKAQQRIASLKSVSPNFDLGNGMSVSAFAALIEQTRTQLEKYNTALSLIDQSKNRVGELEQSLSDMSERLLSGCASVYGRTSEEYEMAGGKKRDRRRATRKSAPDQPTVAIGPDESTAATEIAA